MKRFVADQSWPIPYLYDESQEVAHALDAVATPHVFVFDADHRLVYQGAPDSDHTDESQDAAWLRGAIDAVLEGRDAGAAGDPAARLQRQVARLTLTGSDGQQTQAAGGHRKHARPPARTRAPGPSLASATSKFGPTWPVLVVSGRSPISVITSTISPATTQRDPRRPRPAEPGADRHHAGQERDREPAQTSAARRRYLAGVGQIGVREVVHEAVATSTTTRFVTSARTIRRAAATPSTRTTEPDAPLRLKRAWKAGIPLLESPTAFGSSRRLFTEGWRPRPHKAADPEATLRGMGPGRAFFLLQNRE